MSCLEFSLNSITSLIEDTITQAGGKAPKVDCPSYAKKASLIDE